VHAQALLRLNAKRERAKAIALAYLTKHHIELPGDAKVDDGEGTYQAEIEPRRHFYGVSVSVPLIPHKRSYIVDLDPEDPGREFIYTKPRFVAPGWFLLVGLPIFLYLISSGTS
jgi:hypothetical protein